MSSVLEMSRVDFGLRVNAYMREHGVESLIVAIFAVVDELNELAIVESGKQFVCRRGCDYCCHQRVCCQQPEWEEIEKYLDRKHRLQKSRSHFREALEPWQKFRRENIDKQLIASARKIMETQAKSFGIACPFLKNKVCLIYPVRPLDCRTAFSEAKCGTGQGRKASSFYPFEFHFHAAHLINQEQQLRYVHQRSQPMSEWLETLLRKRGML